MSDLEMPSAIKQINRRARKEHKCCECRSVIKKGETYEYISGIWEGKPNSYKTCKSCVEIREDYNACTGEEAGFGFLKEVISDCCFYKDYGAKQYISDYPQLKVQLEKLFGEDE